MSARWVSRVSVLVYVLSAFVIQCSGNKVPVRSNVPLEIDLDISNAFVGCTIHAINFHGLDIIFRTQTQPIILWRYF